MTANLWSGHGPVIADTSAWIAGRRIPAARQAMLDAVERGDIAWCWPVRYELMIDARDEAAILALDRTLDALREIRVDWATQREVLATIRELASQDGHGSHRLPLADLTVAVAARTSGLDVLHFDHHFERLATLLDIRGWWLADPSGA